MYENKLLTPELLDAYEQRVLTRIGQAEAAVPEAPGVAGPQWLRSGRVVRPDWSSVMAKARRVPYRITDILAMPESEHLERTPELMTLWFSQEPSWTSRTGHVFPGVAFQINIELETTSMINAVDLGFDPSLGLVLAELWYYGSSGATDEPVARWRSIALEEGWPEQVFAPVMAERMMAVVASPGAAKVGVSPTGSVLRELPVLPGDRSSEPDGVVLSGLRYDWQLVRQPVLYCAEGPAVVDSVIQSGSVRPVLEVRSEIAEYCEFEPLANDTVTAPTHIVNPGTTSPAEMVILDPERDWAVTPGEGRGQCLTLAAGSYQIVCTTGTGGGWHDQRDAWREGVLGWHRRLGVWWRDSEERSAMSPETVSGQPFSGHEPRVSFTLEDDCDVWICAVSEEAPQGHRSMPILVFPSHTESPAQLLAPGQWIEFSGAYGATLSLPAPDNTDGNTSLKSIDSVVLDLASPGRPCRVWLHAKRFDVWHFLGELLVDGHQKFTVGVGYDNVTTLRLFVLPTLQASESWVPTADSPWFQVATPSRLELKAPIEDHLLVAAYPGVVRNRLGLSFDDERAWSFSKIDHQLATCEIATIDFPGPLLSSGMPVGPDVEVTTTAAYALSMHVLELHTNVGSDLEFTFRPSDGRPEIFVFTLGSGQLSITQRREGGDDGASFAIPLLPDAGTSDTFSVRIGQYSNRRYVFDILQYGFWRSVVAFDVEDATKYWTAADVVMTGTPYDLTTSSVGTSRQTAKLVFSDGLGVLRSWQWYENSASEHPQDLPDLEDLTEYGQTWLAIENTAGRALALADTLDTAEREANTSITLPWPRQHHVHPTRERLRDCFSHVLLPWQKIQIDFPEVRLPQPFINAAGAQDPIGFFELDQVGADEWVIETIAGSDCYVPDSSEAKATVHGLRSNNFALDVDLRWRPGVNDATVGLGQIALKFEDWQGQSVTLYVIYRSTSGTLDGGTFAANTIGFRVAINGTLAFSVVTNQNTKRFRIFSRIENFVVGGLNDDGEYTPIFAYHTRTPTMPTAFDGCSVHAHDSWTPTPFAIGDTTATFESTASSPGITGLTAYHLEGHDVLVILDAYGNHVAHCQLAGLWGSTTLLANFMPIDNTLGSNLFEVSAGAETVDGREILQIETWFPTALWFEWEYMDPGNRPEIKLIGQDRPLDLDVIAANSKLGLQIPGQIQVLNWQGQRLRVERVKEFTQQVWGASTGSWIYSDSSSLVCTALPRPCLRVASIDIVYNDTFVKRDRSVRYWLEVGGQRLEARPAPHYVYCHEPLETELLSDGSPGSLLSPPVDTDNLARTRFFADALQLISGTDYTLEAGKLTLKRPLSGIRAHYPPDYDASPTVGPDYFVSGVRRSLVLDLTGTELSLPTPVYLDPNSMVFQQELREGAQPVVVSLNGRAVPDLTDYKRWQSSQSSQSLGFWTDGWRVVFNQEVQGLVEVQWMTLPTSSAMGAHIVLPKGVVRAWPRFRTDIQFVYYSPKRRLN